MFQGYARCYTSGVLNSSHFLGDDFRETVNRYPLSRVVLSGQQMSKRWHHHHTSKIQSSNEKKVPGCSRFIGDYTETSSENPSKQWIAATSSLAPKLQQTLPRN